ncbi:hypothetical protein C5167_019271 [Papaver somniferum]|uniref:Mediator of RNA polymerase II transcription subunit 4 n=1 Tax=Papaver somniferum TaxID=3469 RepID=A0A4Y7ITM5_PAPSO|nr:mediator of RNA polymerase II transcription subunit 4-like [Papaver somniferum]RZC50838.1 hypothetical protein C5167_019271 [Papaver somniferum]
MLQNQSPQILQSPARLGLTNPNSPSFSNPATPKLTSQNHFQQQQQQTPSAIALPTATITTTSSSLLSLLPPLSRAQSLLLQMASLASKLFEVSPNRASWFTSFRGSLPTFLASQTLTLNPPPPDSTPTSPKEIISLFTSLQTQLFESVAELQEILDLQDAKQKIAREIKAKDAVILAFANKLKEAENVLDLLVDDYSDYRQPKRSKSQGNSDDTEMTSTTTTSIATSLKLNDILSYAHRISYTTFAPPEFGAGQAPLRGALPPAPQEEQMRASQLYNFADLDIGLPKIESNEKTIETLVEAPGLATENNKLGDLAAVQGLLPPHLTIPSGWRPGMPVELPAEFPIIPPAGWKPGDPVPLPPLDAIVPGKVEEQQPRRAPPMPVKGPEPFQVPHVQLDIDQEDSSSEYSSEGSSEED